MPCVAIPAPPLPVLPTFLSLTPPAPPEPPTVPGACCKLPINIPDTPPIPIPPILLNGATIAALNGYVEAALAYIAALPPPCPRG